MQADATELYLRTYRVLKMSFQGHEAISPSKTINKTTCDRETRNVSNMPHSLRELTTFYLGKTGTNSFDRYNIRAWTP